MFLLIQMLIFRSLLKMMSTEATSGYMRESSNVLFLMNQLLLADFAVERHLVVRTSSGSRLRD